MPIEIKELVIRAAVGSGNNSRQPVSPSVSSDIMKLKKEITNEVTERVLKTLKQNNER